MKNKHLKPFMDFPIGPMTAHFDHDSLGYVYIVGIEQDGVVKIGSTVSLIGRLSELQIGCPFELHVKAAVSVYEGDQFKIEGAAHQLARLNWVRGEWFNLKTVEALEIVLRAARNKKAKVGAVSTAYHKHFAAEAERIATGPARIEQEEADRRRVLRMKLGMDA